MSAPKVLQNSCLPLNRNARPGFMYGIGRQRRREIQWFMPRAHRMPGKLLCELNVGLRGSIREFTYDVLDTGQDPAKCDPSVQPIVKQGESNGDKEGSRCQRHGRCRRVGATDFAINILRHRVADCWALTSAGGRNSSASVAYVVNIAYWLVRVRCIDTFHIK